MHKKIEHVLKNKNLLSSLWLAGCVLIAIIGFKYYILAVILSICFLLYTFKKNLKIAIFLSLLCLFFQYYNQNLSFALSTPIKYSKYISVYTSSGYQRFNLTTNIKVGNALYKGDKIFHFPIISEVLEYRHKVGQYWFYASGGEVFSPQANILGTKYYIPQKYRDMYTLSGLAHLIAESGLNIGIFVGLLYWLLRLLRIKKASLIIFLILPLAIPLSGFATTVVRATLFTEIFILLRYFNLYSRLNRFTIFLAGILILLDFNSIVDISFLLSFAAVYGIASYLEQDKPRKLWNLVLIGVAATLFTFPMQLYFFGTANYFSILSSIIMSFIVTISILFSCIGLVIPSITLPILEVIQHVNNFMLETIFKITYPFYILQSISTVSFVLVYAFIIFFTLIKKLRAIALIALLLPFIINGPNKENSPDIIIPNLGPTKGFVQLNDTTKLFFQGSYNEFKYNFVPFLAKYEIKKFQEGDVRVFGGYNYYFKIKNKLSMGYICVNKVSKSCKILYVTRSNSIKQPLEDITYIVYKNSLKAPNIIEYYNLSEIQIIQGKIHLIE